LILFIFLQIVYKFLYINSNRTRIITPSVISAPKNQYLLTVNVSSSQVPSRSFPENTFVYLQMEGNTGTPAFFKKQVQRKEIFLNCNTLKERF